MSRAARPSCGGIFDFEAKQRRLAEVSKLAEDPAVWSDNKRAQELGRERKSLESLVSTLVRLDNGLRDARELFEMAKGERDEATLVSIDSDALGLEKTVADMEFRRMFSNPMDPANCFLDIQAGSGGTEAQDWAAML
jgi:peptide chain release factor 2